MTAPPANPPAPLHFRARHRLTHARQFQAVFGARQRRGVGPISVFAAPNGLDHPRLGLSISRKVGSAVVRNAIKRRVREAFRLSMPDLPPGLDLVVSAQKHHPMKPERYSEILVKCARGLARAISHDKP